MSKDVEVDERLVGLVWTIHNCCDLFAAVHDFGDLSHAIPTLLEHIHQTSQTIQEDYCIDKDSQKED
ncbi:unnamed protein product [marine sediment metagenome]|uniref:Uncharacterized protein n=1 Tax=marine sediment metagenome TaxID=412755 RepID=X0UHU5_9ZZZZ